MDHPYYSPWYEWPFIGKPMWYYSDSNGAYGTASTIMALGNPAVWWSGIAGGQMPIQRRLPKFGFKNPTRVEYKAVNLADVEALAQAGLAEIGVAEFKAAGLAGKNDLVKVLGNGEITAAVTVCANAFSKSAISKIEAAGGKTIVIK